MKKKLLFVAPHLSTGGMPQYLYKKIETLLDDYEIHIVEYSSVTGGVLVVQRNRIMNILPEENFYVLGEDKQELIRLIETIQPEIIHLEEMPEYFMEYEIASQIYTKDRKYNIFETSHDSSFDVSSKRFFPDKFFLVSNYQIKNIEPLGIPCVLAEYPIEYKDRPNREEALAALGLDPEYKHVINVGLFTPRKNQAEVFEYAKKLEGYKIKFHFIGNQADNFKFYWEPLMKDVPENCVVWGERSDVHKFYEAADLFLFTSKGFVTDKETSPLVIRESIGYRVPSLIYNLPVYLGMYDKYENINYLSTEEGNEDKILEILGIEKKEDNYKKIMIVDVYATTEDKLNLLRKCIASVKNLGYPIMIVSHCTLPEDIVKSVEYHLFDADNQFNNNHVFSFRTKGDITINNNIRRSHEFPIIRAMKLATETAKNLGYDFFYLTEFDHDYSENGINQIKELEKKFIFGDYNLMLFHPPSAVFGSIVGKYFDTCFFFGYLDYFIGKFNSYFPTDLEEYNEKFAPRFPNCLEHFFYELFSNEKCLVVDDYVKSYFKDSQINISSYGDTSYKILVDKNLDDCYLVITNNNLINYEYEVYLDNSMIDSFVINSDFKILHLPTKGGIKIDVYRDGLKTNTFTSDFDPEKIEDYRKDGSIVFATEEARNKTKSKAMEILSNQTGAEAVEKITQKEDRVPFDLFFNKDENKIIFTFTEDVVDPVSVSIKDIDSRACIYHLNIGPSQKGFDWWAMPLPKHVIDFENNPRFGGFHVEVHNSNKEFLGVRQLKIKDIEIKKPLMDITDTEPTFMNYEEFFVDRVYDVLPLDNQRVVLDIGANVGLWTKYILSKGAGKVYCFEPNLKAIDHLKNTLKEDINTQIVEKAVYKEKATLQFHVDDSNSLISSLIPEPGKSPSYDVDAITLEDAINLTGHQNIDLVKIDIEGAEFEIIENLQQEIADRIDSFLIEFHDFYFDNGMHKVDALEQKIKDLGFTTYRLPGYKVIYASKIRKNYWLNRKGIIESRNLFDTSKVFTWENMDKGKQDGYNHLMNEMHHTFDQYTKGNIYERYGCVIEEGDIVVDAGANVGAFSNYAYHKGAKEIYAFEPADTAFECLVRNKPFGAKIFKAALGNKIGLGKFIIPSQDDTMSTSLHNVAGIENFAPVLSLNHLFETGLFNKIDFLKIDCEGAEKEIMAGLSDENLGKVKKIALEFHKNYLSEEFSEELITRMSRNNFRVFQLFIGDGNLRIYNFWKI